MLFKFYKQIDEMIGGHGNRTLNILKSIINHPNKSEFGMYAIHHACNWQIESKNDKNIIYQAPINVIQLLLDNGANINQMATYGRWTSLDYAMDKENKNLIAFLRKHGAMTSNQLHGIVDSDDDDVMNAECGDEIFEYDRSSSDQKTVQR